MTIRDYADRDERGWVLCRLVSFLDCSYFDDVRREKEKYQHPSVCLVAEDDGQIIGIIDVEYEENPGDVCYLEGVLGAVLWHLGVLPQYRGRGVAKALWDAAKKKVSEKGIRRFEVWTQDDPAANGWYRRQGFQHKESYLSAYLKGDPSAQPISSYVHARGIGDCYGIRCLNLEVPLERREEMERICYRLHEVKLFELRGE